jgi:hypothetical protein
VDFQAGVVLEGDVRIRVDRGAAVIVASSRVTGELELPQNDPRA